MNMSRKSDSRARTMTTRLAIAAFAVLGVSILIVQASTARAAEVCSPRSAGAPLLVTADCLDPRFDQPYIDVEEWRDEPAETPSVLGLTTQRHDAPHIKVRHLYVHGGFKGTDAKFSFYLPPKEQYQGRFYQTTHQLLTSEEAAPYNIAMSVASGAYFVQTNMGGSEIARTAEDAASGRTDPSIGTYRVNAAAAKYSRVVATRIYGRHRTFGYLYGGSGGSIQTIASAESTVGVWDGFIPYVMGNPVTNPSKFLARANALRLLKDVWPTVMDGFEPGGGDPYAGLNGEQKEALQEVTRYGFPPRAWHNYVPQGTGPLGFVAAFVPIMDPAYEHDFWSKAGYGGSDPSSSAAAARIQHSARVVRVVTGPSRGPFLVATQLELSSVPTGDVTGADLIIKSGAAEGQSAPVGAVVGGLVSFGLGANPAMVSTFKAGDEVTIDNSRYLALQSYYRYSIPPKGSVYDHPAVFDSFRNANGTPKYPQREFIVGLKQSMMTGDQADPGRIRGKMIVVQSLMDGDALPWEAAWYHSKVRDVLGKSAEDTFRIWFTDHGQHTAPLTPADQTHVVSYQGLLEQALRDLSVWVEKGVAPPASTQYTVVEGQVRVPAEAGERKGIQPVVALKVGGGVVRAEVTAGSPVSFRATIEVPPGTGTVVSADWDFEGTGEYAVAEKLSNMPSSKVNLTTSHTFTKPGTYFPALRATSQRQGNAETPYARVQNLGRVRVVVK